MIEPQPAAREYEVRAPAPRADEHPRILKHGETFAVLDHFGNIGPAGLGEEGIYHHDTRHLSCLSLTLNDAYPMLLSTTGVDDGATRTEDLTNLDLFEDGELLVPFGALHLARTKLIWQAACHERVRLTNYGDRALTIRLRIEIEADFADIFEVRGTTRPARGALHPPVLRADGLQFRYDGLDGLTRTTTVQTTPQPSVVTERALLYNLAMAAHETCVIDASYTFEEIPARPTFVQAFEAVEASRRGMKQGYCRIATSNEQFDAWLDRSFIDLQMLVTETPSGLYPYAGVPWFSTIFGRDGLVTALQTLWVNPGIARGVLVVLAGHQGIEVAPERVETPGKILHELRDGEMARLGNVPFGRYYGSADATPLFVLLAGEYIYATGDLAFAKALWPNVERALIWIEQFGDLDGDGFIEYETTDSRGLTNQGWKDSWDSVFHADGALAPGPIALVEVQAYVYAAKRSIARVAAALGHEERARELLHEADELRRRFDAAYWCDAIQTYALALDGAKQRCAVRSSNAGHALFAGIAEPARAARVVAQLLTQGGYSEWGVRTVAEGEARYNPMSYHNGSIWPHDNALIAAGLADYGFGDGTLALLTGLFQASLFVDLHRLPELFCGFERRAGDGPTLYPLACAPQAWASGAPFMLLHAALGLNIDALKGELCFRYPRLPPYLTEVELTGLRVGSAEVDVRLHRYREDIGINVTRRDGDVGVIVIK